METTQKPKIFYGYIIVLACFFIMIVYWGVTYSYGIFFDSLVKEFGWDRALTSGAYSIMGLLFGLTSIPTAKLCDKFGPRIVISSCGVFMGIGYI
jgi:OFA family oxalate/formate antiporter-like MFS transporter